MTEVKRSALVARPARELYELVLDVDAYQDFLPWCSRSATLEQSDSRQLASVSIDVKVREITFVTENTLEAPSRIALQLVDGPFKSLAGEWRFLPLAEDSCKVELDLEFEFASGAMAGDKTCIQQNSGHHARCFYRSRQRAGDLIMVAGIGMYRIMPGLN